jgi:cytidylate kinase
MFRVITISREYGSGGESLAGILASRLDWRLVDDALVTEIARKAKITADVARRCDESLDPWFQRLLKALWRGGFEGAASRVDADAFDAEAMARLWNRLILESAELGDCVIVGRGGQCLLQRRRDTFHVSVYAPIRDRVRRIRERQPRESDPEAVARSTDAMRAAYVQRHFGQDVTNYHLYHLMICSTIGLENAADTIMAAAGLSAKRSSPAGSR